MAFLSAQKDLLSTQKKVTTFLKPKSGRKFANHNFMMAAALEAAITKKLTALEKQQKEIIKAYAQAAPSSDYINFLA